MNPILHSNSSMKKFKGETNEDFKQFLTLHEKMDCTKSVIADNRHRCISHTMFWIREVMIPIYGSFITLSSGRKVSVKDICEQHILEDFKMKFIPTPQDFIQEMTYKKWMQNGSGIPPSAKKLYPELTKNEQNDEHEYENSGNRRTVGRIGGQEEGVGEAASIGTEQVE